MTGFRFRRRYCQGIYRFMSVLCAAVGACHLEVTSSPMAAIMQMPADTARV